ncbi:MAG TPA: carboxypeptidase-like regulatory domain-containing protein, partial [Planctomycetaceae bacterium]|nr:carboxypeptidase-like regulatory domain-containing protein [Planctomycetaceae bacterium]
LASVANAQEFRGTILGRVTDPQGAAIPHVTVVVTNEATNVASESLSENDGAYAVPFLIPGKYKIETTLAGFKSFVRSGVTVGINQHATVDIKLELGNVTEIVDVRAEASLLDRASGGLGQTIDNTRIEAMPLNGRMIFMLNRLAGGVNWQVPTFGSTGTSGLRPFDNGGGSAWSIAGGRVSTNEFLLDGVPNSTRGRYNFGPPVDAVEEFRIQTNTYDAQYGRTGGGVVNMTLKSGGNTFKGQAWNFLKNDVLNANDTLNNSQHQPKPPYIANQYGVTVTGPIVRNRTFFMSTFEGLRERVPFPTTTSVPTVAERSGDFSRSYTDQKTPLVIYDPVTTACDAQGRCTRTPFPNNVIPADRINPIALKILNTIYPPPTIADQRLNNFVNPVNKARYDYDSELARIDHKFSDTSKLFVSVHHNHRDEFRSTNGLQGTFA